MRGTIHRQMPDSLAWIGDTTDEFSSASWIPTISAGHTESKDHRGHEAQVMLIQKPHQFRSGQRIRHTRIWSLSLEPRPFSGRIIFRCFPARAWLNSWTLIAMWVASGFSSGQRRETGLNVRRRCSSCNEPPTNAAASAGTDIFDTPDCDLPRRISPPANSTGNCGQQASAGDQ